MRGPDDVGAVPDPAVQAPDEAGAAELGGMLAGEGHVRKDITRGVAPDPASW
jgi:hypothetical protein